MAQEDRPFDRIVVTKTLKRFRRSQRGGVTILFGLMAIALFAMIGLAVDLGRWVNARDHTISAIDAAVLAAGRALQTGSDANKAKDIALAYYNTAIETRIKTINDDVRFEVLEDGLAVTATGTATIVTPFMAMLGYKELPLLRASGGVQIGNDGSSMPVARIAVGGQGGQNVETVLMLDVSGSMQGSKLRDMKDAAKDLVNIVVWEDQSEYTSRVSLVPFSADVRPPSNLLSLVANAGNSNMKRTYYHTYETGSGKKKKTVTDTYQYAFKPTACVAERGGTPAYTDDLPLLFNKLTRVHRRTNTSSSETSCYIHEDAEVLPLSNDKSELLNRIEGLVAEGGTAGHVGTAWAYYMLSPKWSPILANRHKPAGYGRDDTRKVAVLMTDGEYNFTYDNDQAPSSEILGSEYNPTGQGIERINNKNSAEQAKMICDNMKANGIEVFTVGFALGNNQSAKNTMAYCASSADQNYDAEDGEDLKNAFRDIALQISKLYLSN